MSAFLCDQQHFQQIADYLASKRDWSMSKFLGVEYDAPREDCEHAAVEMVNKLYMLNQYALSERYGDKVETRRIVNKISGNFHIRPVQFYKALTCLRYQCSEGDATDQELYQRLDKFIGKVAEDIVSDSSEYVEAESVNIDCQTEGLMFEGNACKVFPEEN